MDSSPNASYNFCGSLMSIINTNIQDNNDLPQTVQQLAEQVNQLTNMLDGKEISESTIIDGTVYQRSVKFSLLSGMVRGEWKAVNEDGVDSIIAGTGISVDSVAGIGDVTVANTGVTSLIAGTLITIDPVGGTGDVTINGTAELPASATQYQVLAWSGLAWAADWTRWV